MSNCPNLPQSLICAGDGEVAQTNHYYMTLELTEQPVLSEVPDL